MISLKVQGSDDRLHFDVSAIAIAGYTGRDQISVQRHIEELRRQGVPGPSQTPVLFVATPDMLTQESVIDVVGGSTTGEVEFVLIQNASGDIFVTVGSDHTDRLLEKADIPASKQVCPKVIGREAWRLDDLESHWDSIQMRSWVRGLTTPYQDGLVSEIVPPRDIIRLASTRAPDALVNVVIFGGTLPLSTSTFVPGDFRAELNDPILGRRLSIEYVVHPLGWKTDT